MGRRRAGAGHALPLGAREIKAVVVLWGPASEFTWTPCVQRTWT